MIARAAARFEVIDPGLVRTRGGARTACATVLTWATITFPKGSRLGIESGNGRWPAHQDRRTRASDASLARSAGADMKLLQVTMGHASIMVTAHTNADLYDSDLDRVADALDGLGG
jgi:integrase